jgi:hypothetical protein
MPVFLGRLVELAVIKGFTMLIERAGKKTVARGLAVDAAVEAFRKAYAEAYDGTPVTPAQRKRLHESIAAIVQEKP